MPATYSSEQELGEDHSFVLLGDSPYQGVMDPLGFNELADGLVNVILSSAESSPMTIGVEGSWGRGKSSLMQMVERELVERNPSSRKGGQRIRTVWYNAWTGKDKNVLEGLVKTVLQSMDPNILRKALRNKKLVRGLRLVLTVVASFLRLGDVTNRIWDRLAVDPTARNEIKELMSEAMNDWIAAYAKSSDSADGDRILVVFIDDLDRCSPDAVLEIFEAVKLYLDAPGFVFVIGYDDQIISDAILRKKNYSAAVTGRDYVEKIVQVAYRIPPPTETQSQNLLAEYLQASQTGHLFTDPTEQKVIIDRNAKNPRRIKRFINSFVIEHELDPGQAHLTAGERSRILMLQMYYPDYWRLLRAGEEPESAIDEFLKYIKARNALRASMNLDQLSEEDQSLITSRFDYYGVAVPEDIDGSSAAVLELLEQEIPEQFPSLAQDNGFVSIVRYLGEDDFEDEIEQKIRQRGEGMAPNKSEALFESVTRTPLADSYLLWIDDRPENKKSEVERLREDGATVIQVENLDQALRKLSQDSHINLLISDIGRGDREDAGFEDLESIREEHSDYPTIFYTSRVTPARRKRAEKLGAAITNSVDELERLVRSKGGRELK